MHSSTVESESPHSNHYSCFTTLNHSHPFSLYILLLSLH
uniref:Uncharacterized protein n=1 Tax=Arundo donax TaxID=35708 RepID=A0A0A9BPE1_ARUDO